MKSKEEIQKHIDYLEKDLKNGPLGDDVSDFYVRGQIAALRWMVYEDPVAKAPGFSWEAK